MNYTRIAIRVASSDKVKVWVDEDTGLFKVEFNGQTSSALMPEDPDEGEPKDLVGDINILRGAVSAWDGQSYFEMTPEEFSKFLVDIGLHSFLRPVNITGDVRAL